MNKTELEKLVEDYDQELRKLNSKVITMREQVIELAEERNSLRREIKKRGFKSLRLCKEQVDLIYSLAKGKATELSQNLNKSFPYYTHLKTLTRREELEIFLEFLKEQGR